MVTKHPLQALLEALRASAVGFEIVEGRLVMTGPELGARGRRLVAEHELQLRAIAIGRRTGHAPAFCRCGEWSMLSIVNSSGTSRSAPSAGWPRCPFCGRTGTRRIAEVDAEGVERVRPPGVPSLKRWLELQGRQTVAGAIAALELDEE